MNRQRILKFIQDSKQYLKESSPQQKVKILKLIKEARQQMLDAEMKIVRESETKIIQEDNSSNNADYLEEK